MYETEIIEAILTGRRIDADEKKIKQTYQERLDSIVDNLKDSEFAIPTIMCGISGKQCEYDAKCSTCIVALSTMSTTSNEMEEREIDLIHFDRKKDKKNGIDYMATPSGKIRRYDNKAQMMAHMGLKIEDITEGKKEDTLPVIKSHPSIYETVLTAILENTEKVYFAKETLIFERHGGSVIVFKTV